MALPPWRPPPPRRFVVAVDLLRTWWSAPRLRAGGLAAVSLVAGALWYRADGDRAGLVRLVEEASTPAVPGQASPGRPSIDMTPLVVHVAGAVARPGLVRVSSGARVADALEAAGGPVGEADVDRLNLAARLLDGQQVMVFRLGEVARQGEVAGAPDRGTEPQSGGGTVDLNTATVAELDGLPGIGPATARAIIGYRERHGGFRSVRQLLDVGGIGERRLDELRQRVRV